MTISAFSHQRPPSSEGWIHSSSRSITPLTLASTGPPFSESSRRAYWSRAPSTRWPFTGKAFRTRESMSLSLAATALSVTRLLAIVLSILVRRVSVKRYQQVQLEVVSLYFSYLFFCEKMLSFFSSRKRNVDTFHSK